jgi:hypothetical protein
MAVLGSQSGTVLRPSIANANELLESQIHGHDEVGNGHGQNAKLVGLIPLHILQ